MTQHDVILNSLPDDIAIKIASSLQVSELCSLGSCSRFWRELCKSDCLWESLAKQRWPFLGLLEPSSSSPSSSSINITEWRIFYIERHSEMANRAEKVVNFVEESESIESGDYLKAIENLFAMQLGFEDVEMFLLSPKLNSLLNLVGLHYSISWLRVPGEIVAETARRRGISERQICVKWWKLGRWFYGFRMRDESRSRQLSLADLVGPTEAEVLGVLTRGAVHEVMRVQISSPDPSFIPWHCLNAQAQD